MLQYKTKFLLIGSLMMFLVPMAIGQTLQVNPDNNPNKTTIPNKGTETTQTQPRQIPVSEFFRHPEKTSYKLSPDGINIAYLGVGDGRMNVFIAKSDGSNPHQLTHSTDRDLDDYFWGNNNTILYLKDNGGDENFHLYSTDITSEDKSKDLTPYDKVTVSILDDLYNDDENVLIEMNKENQQVFDVYKLNLKSGDATMVLKNPGNYTGFITDHNGVIRIAMATDGVNQTVYYRVSEEQPWSVILTTDFKNEFTPLLFDNNNQGFYVLCNIDRDKSAIYYYKTIPNYMSTISATVEDETQQGLSNIEDIKSNMKLLYENNDYDLSGLNYSEARQLVTSYTYTDVKRHVEFTDDLLKTAYLNIQSKIGTNNEIVFTCSDKKEAQYVIRTYSDKSLGSYYLYNVVATTLTKLADVSPWLNEEMMCTMQPIKFTARDGQIINGYLTLPNGVPAKNLPMIVNPHGGPWARDNWGFNPEVQFLANRGYAVLQINYRGSTGYGKKFWEQSFKQWGQSMQNDISDGVIWAIKSGYADMHRVGIYGASYGGYATLAGLAFTPNLYACGVDYVGVSNLFTFMKTIPPYWAPYLQMMYTMVGNPNISADSVMMYNYSPVFHADKITAPLFIAQGKNDPRVNINESNQMVDALKKRNVDVEYMVKENEGHGFHNEENQIDFYTAMDAFFAKHLLGVQ